jgi:D-alanyl-D-alanine carboxypeptidase (penicillin-binding protein 5/6)
MNNPTFADIVKTPKISLTIPQRSFALANTNPLLGNYPGVDGVKTGSTDEAGQCVIASATQAGRRVFVTLMDSGNRVSDGTALFEYAFKQFGLWSFALPQSPLYFAHDAKGASYSLVASSDNKVCLPLWQSDAIWSDLSLTGDPDNLVDFSKPIGEFTYHPGDEPTIKIPVYAKP